MSLPTNVGSGRIVGRFVVGVIDSPDDTDDEPELIPAQGTITFTPSIGYVPNSTTEIPMTIMKAPITGVLDSEGYLCTPDNTTTPEGGLTRGVKLFATDVGQVTGWTYTVKYSFTPVGTVVPHIPEHPLTVPDKSIQDLTKVAPTPFAPVIGIPQMEAAVLRAEAAAQSVVDRANSGEFIGDTGPVNTLEIGSVEFIEGSALDSEVIDAQISTPGTVANDALVAETRLAVLEKAGSFLMDPFSVGTVTTGAAGSTASATITGESPNRSLNLTLPKGDPGGWVTGAYLGTQNLDTILIDGPYRQDLSANATLERGYPTTSAGVLLVYQAAGSQTMFQQYMASYGASTGSRNIWLRTRNGGTWNPWRTFASTRIDNNAGRAIYMWDDSPGSSRDQLIYGDTGWRDMGTFDLDGVTGVFRLCRVGSSVFLMGSIAKETSGTTFKAGSIPVGFRPRGAVEILLTQGTGLAPNGKLVAQYSGQVVWYMPPGSATQSSFEISWRTTDAWPKTLPGTADGTIPNL